MVLFLAWLLITNHLCRGGLLQYGPNRGTGLRYHPQRYPEMYKRHDLSFKEACCGVANMSSLYYSRRPTDDCSAYQQPALSEPCSYPVPPM